VTQALLQADDLVKEFRVPGAAPWRRASLRAVDGVSLSLAAGETLGLVGESGSGKSTLARLLVRLIEPSDGTIRFAGQDVLTLSGRELRALRARAQLVFQDPWSSLDPRYRVAAIVAEPLRIHRKLGETAIQARVRELLDEVGLDAGFLSARPHELSGGQRQRVGIARALACEPELLIADEPVSALDVSVQAQILNLLLDLTQRRGLAMLFISHDLAVVEHLSHRVAVMYLGRVVETAPAAELFADPRHPYTRALLDARPGLDPERPARPVLGGEIASPTARPTGCAFHPRCPHAVERCRVEAPALRQLGPARTTACHLA
jgi:oligopeptide/dipeptide ABC transporter ATP-binding protein